MLGRVVSGSRTWIWTMAAPALAASIAESAICAGVTGTAGLRAGVSAEPVTAQEIMILRCMGLSAIANLRHHSQVGAEVLPHQQISRARLRCTRRFDRRAWPQAESRPWPPDLSAARRERAVEAALPPIVCCGKARPFPSLLRTDLKQGRLRAPAACWCRPGWSVRAGSAVCTVRNLGVADERVVAGISAAGRSSSRSRSASVSHSCWYLFSSPTGDPIPRSSPPTNAASTLSMTLA